MELRSDKQVALNELFTACAEIADFYQDEIERHDLQALQETIKMLAAKHRTTAVQLAEEIRRTGDLPQLPDPDAETFSKVLKHIQESFVKDAVILFIKDSESAEERLLNMFSNTLKLDWSADARSRLKVLQRDIQNMLDTIHSLFPSGDVKE